MQKVILLNQGWEKKCVQYLTVVVTEVKVLLEKKSLITISNISLKNVYL